MTMILFLRFQNISVRRIQLNNLLNRNMQTKISVGSIDIKMVKSHLSNSDNTSTTSTSLSNSEKNSVIICRAGDSKNNMESISQKLLKVHSSSILGTAVKALDDLMKKNKKLEHVKKYNELKQKNSSIMLLIQKCLQKKTVKNIDANQDSQPRQKIENKSNNPQEHTKILNESFRQKQYFQFDIQGQKEVFIVVKFINEGISGKVYLVKHSKTGFIFSLKVIPRNKINHENTNQLIRQLKIQSYLNHPNIIKLYHFNIDQDNVHLLLQPCLGFDLFKQIKAHPKGLPQKQVKNIVRQVSSAVQYMHKNDIIHRDLKLQNILICDGVVKICDFGWAVHSPLLRATRCGTPLYVSPQMLKSEHYDSKIDIWNIGVLTYELIYGYSPFQIRQQSDFIKIIEQDVFFSSRKIASQSLQNFINGCLSKNPFKRFCIRQVIEHQFLINVQKMRWTIL